MEGIRLQFSFMEVLPFRHDKHPRKLAAILLQARLCFLWGYPQNSGFP